MPSTPRPRGRTIDEYLASVESDQRRALERLRRIIRRTAPKATECINYGVPAFRLDGRMLVGFGAGATHCSFYPGSGTTVAAHRAVLKGFDTSKGAIRFTCDRPLPEGLVRTLVRARLAEEKARAARPAQASGSLQGWRSASQSSTRRGRLSRGVRVALTTK